MIGKVNVFKSFFIYIYAFCISELVGSNRLQALYGGHVDDETGLSIVRFQHLPG